MSTAPFASNATALIFQAFVPGVTQKITTSGSSQQSATLLSKTTLVRVTCDQDCFVAFGDSPTANTTTTLFMPAGAIEYFGVAPSTKVAVLQSTAAGSFYLTQGA